MSKGGRERERFSDPDASWGHRSAVSTRKGGRFYGFKLHAAVCARTELPVAWDVRSAKDAEVPVLPELLDAMMLNGFAPETCVADKGYDATPVYEACEARGIRPIIPLRKTPFVKVGKATPPSCEHRAWAFAGSDEKRGAAKYRCPTGECSPASVWIKADRLHTLLPRESARWRKLYRSRGAVERGFGRLKNEWGLQRGKNDPWRSLGILSSTSPVAVANSRGRCALRWVVRVSLRSWRRAPTTVVASASISSWRIHSRLLRMVSVTSPALSAASRSDRAPPHCHCQTG